MCGRGGEADDEYPELWSYDDGREAGWRVGYRQAIRDVERDAERLTLLVTWGLVAAFAAGGVFGVVVCRVVWPLVEAGVLP